MTFDGTMKNVINLSNVFQCVKGNNPRSFSFMIQTSQTTEGAIIETGSWSHMNSFTIGIGWNSRKTTVGTISVYGVNADYTMTSGMTSPVINDNQWHSVIVSWDGTTLRFFIDNILVCSTSAFNYLNPAAVETFIKYNTVGDHNYLGCVSEANGYFFVGNLKNIAVFDTAYPFTLAPSTAPTTFGPTISISSSTAAPSTAPSALVVIPNLPPLPTCPEGWTLHATCVWTDGGKRVYQEASPVLAADISYKFTAACTVAGLLIGIMIGMMMLAYCILPSKDKVRNAEYMPIYESG